jgi:hypothetical protein
MSRCQQVWLIEYRSADMPEYEWKFFGVASCEAAAMQEVASFHDVNWYERATYKYARYKFEWSKYLRTYRLRTTELFGTAV